MDDFAYTQSRNAEDWTRGFVPGQTQRERAARAEREGKGRGAACATSHRSLFANRERQQQARIQPGAGV